MQPFYKRLVEIELDAAVYRASIERKLKHPRNSWDPRTLQHILGELRRQAPQFERLDEFACLCVQHLLDVAREYNQETHDPELLLEILQAVDVMAERADNSARTTFPTMQPELKEVIRIIGFRLHLIVTALSAGA